MNRKRLGVMIDCSRNAVMKPETIKRFVGYIKKAGYNAVYLYMEDTYEIDGEPYFGHLRGRYTQAELKEINDFCISEGIEAIPCVQTLAHLNQIFKWNEYKPINDCADILLTNDARTEKLIENMFSSLKKCFDTRSINIGMDEAHLVLGIPHGPQQLPGALQPRAAAQPGEAVDVGHRLLRRGAGQPACFRHKKRPPLCELAVPNGGNSRTKGGTLTPNLRQRDAGYALQAALFVRRTTPRPAGTGPLGGTARVSLLCLRPYYTRITAPAQGEIKKIARQGVFLPMPGRSYHCALSAG